MDRVAPSAPAAPGPGMIAVVTCARLTIASRRGVRSPVRGQVSDSDPVSGAAVATQRAVARPGGDGAGDLAIRLAYQ